MHACTSGFHKKLVELYETHLSTDILSPQNRRGQTYTYTHMPRTRMRACIRTHPRSHLHLNSTPWAGGALWSRAYARTRCIVGDDGLRVPRTIGMDVVDSLLHVAHHLQRDLLGGVLMARGRCGRQAQHSAHTLTPIHLRQKHMPCLFMKTVVVCNSGCLCAQDRRRTGSQTMQRDSITWIWRGAGHMQAKACMPLSSAGCGKHASPCPCMRVRGKVRCG